MKFDDMYPDAQVMDQVDDMLKEATQVPCLNCGYPTTWLEITFQAHLCCPECVEAQWDIWDQQSRGQETR